MRSKERPCVTIPNVQLYAHFYNPDTDSIYTKPIIAIEWTYFRSESGEYDLEGRPQSFNDDGETISILHDDEFLFMDQQSDPPEQSKAEWIDYGRKRNDRMIARRLKG